MFGDRSMEATRGVSSRRSPCQLNGELWGIATFFNPASYTNKLEHLRSFSDAVRRQGLKLLIIELAFGDSPHVVDSHLADRLIQVRSDCVLWQKERLLNLALAHLPRTCDKVAWLDCDILFENGNWVAACSKLLCEYLVVQLYDQSWRLPPGASSRSDVDLGENGAARNRPGLVLAQLNGDPEAMISAEYGLAWAARRSLMSTHQFYDRFIVGGGDMVMCWAMYHELDRWPKQALLRALCSGAQIQDLSRWTRAFHAGVNLSVYYVDGCVLHLWHGRPENRRYLERYRILKEADFDPDVDIEIDHGGCWRWSTDKPKLHRGVRDYFWSRKEQGERLGVSK